MFGGSFDPPHDGHRKIIIESIKEMELDGLIVVPNGQPPHKSLDTAVAHRMEMCRLAFGDIGKVKISGIEADSENVNYTYNTLTKLRNEYPETEFCFIVGGDSVKDFFSWKNYREILNLAKLCIFNRKNVDCTKQLKKIEKIADGKVVSLQSEIPQISSSKIRLHLNCFRSSKQIAPQVNNYIVENDLYTEHRDLAQKVKELMTNCRYVHTVNTAVMAKEIAKTLKDADENKIVIAALLHDCAKCLTPQEMIDIDANISALPQPIRHGHIGAILAEKQFLVTDKDILNAIRYHSTGRPKMSLMEKIIYVADAIEEGRGEVTEPPRALALTDFAEAFKRCLLYRYNFVLDRHSEKSDLTQQAVKFYIKEGGKHDN